MFGIPYTHQDQEYTVYTVYHIYTIVPYFGIPSTPKLFGLRILLRPVTGAIRGGEGLSTHRPNRSQMELISKTQRTAVCML